MLRVVSARARVSVVFVGLGLLTLQGLVPGQVDADGQHGPRLRMVQAAGAIDEATTPESARTVFVGQVIGPDGAPAVGAVVVTSAGGQAVTDAEGAFSLEVGVPADAESVRVTAVMGSGTGSLVGGAQVGTLALWGTTSAGTLVLEQAAACQPSWLPTFGGQPGVDYGISALAVFDDGSGPALYAGGSFTTAGSVPAKGIAKWDGTSWSALGSGMGGTSPYVYALTVFDDGSGPALYAGGQFTTAGSVAANSIAKWNGSSWSALASGISGTPFNTSVEALTVFDDGSGLALYAGGDFTTAGGMAANNIAKWNGTSWSALGSGMNSSVEALTVFDDGSGAALYAGGEFSKAGGVAKTRFIAKWNGSAWSALGSGMNGAVVALTVFDDGSGPALYAGGKFTTAGGVSANRIAKWNGSSWSALGSGMSYLPDEASVVALTVFDDGSGSALYAGGKFSIVDGVSASHVAKWNGTSWSALGHGTSDAITALAAFDDGSGPALYAGQFTSAGGVAANYIAKWDGASWSALGSGMNSSVEALTVFDDGSGPALYAGGYFTTAGGVTVNSIAKWNGTSWSALGRGMGLVGSSPQVDALTVFDDGSGPALYAGGNFTTTGSLTVNYIAKWDGTSWSALGSGMGPGLFGTSVYTLTVFDDGSGPALYAGGYFTTAGGVAANHIAKWNGTSWSALGSGMNSGVEALTVFDDGSGAALYAGGEFSKAGGVAANSIAKWDGTTWTALGGGMSGTTYGFVYALAVFDDGSGPALYAGGGFTTAGGVTANYIAKWNGSSWSALGSGTNGFFVFALTAYDDGSGPALYAGGDFTTAGGVATNYIAKWNGSAWSALGSGLGGSYPSVNALTVFDDGSGSALYAGGWFSTSPAGDSYLAKWGGCSATASPWTNLGSSLPGVSGAPLLEATGTMESGSQNVLNLSKAAPSAVAILFAAPSSLPTPFMGGIVLPDPIYPPTFGMTDAAGTIKFRFILPAGMPSGSQAWIQWGITDAAAVKGVSLSNAVEGVTP